VLALLLRWACAAIVLTSAAAFAVKMTAEATTHVQSPLLAFNEVDAVQQSRRDAAHAASPDPSIPNTCWARCLADPLPDSSIHRPARPGLLESLTLLPIGLRVGSYLRRERKAGRDPIFDLNGPLMMPPQPGPYAGVPLGGIGGGSIGRGFRGDFRRWTLWPGRTVQRAVNADQFSVRVAPSDGSGHAAARVLSVEKASDVEHALRKWKWGLDPAKVHYCALYPRAWHVYDEPVPGVQLTCRQVSPVLPQEYTETSLPVAVFVWTVKNTGTAAADVSLMFTFQNGSGSENDSAGGHSNRPFKVSTDSTSTDSTTAASSSSSSSSKAAVTVKGVELKHLHRSQQVYEQHEEDERNSSRRSCLFSWCKTSKHSKPRTVELAAAESVPTADSIASSPDTVLLQQPTSSTTGSSSSSSRDHQAQHCEDKHYTADRSLTEQYEDPLSFAVGAGDSPGVHVSAVPTFRTTSSHDTAALWKAFRHSGSLADTAFGDNSSTTSTDAASNDVSSKSSSSSSEKGDAIGAAVCQKVTLQPGESRELVFSLAWDAPIARFGGGAALPKRYTR
jgi:beta-glucosidase 2, glycosyl-hydrolase family 116 N-term